MSSLLLNSSILQAILLIGTVRCVHFESICGVPGGLLSAEICGNIQETHLSEMCLAGLEFVTYFVSVCSSLLEPRTLIYTCVHIIYIYIYIFITIGIS
jgi:hypothetical protein